MINLNTHISDILTATGTTLYNLVGTNVFSIVIPDDIDNPVIVLERDFKTNHTTFGIANYECNLVVTVLTTDYDDGITISTLVKNMLVGYEDNNIKYSMLTDIGEDYNVDTFIQKMTFYIIAED